MALLPRVVDSAAERSNDGKAEENASTAEQTHDGLTTTQSRSGPGVVEECGQRATVNLFGRTIVATLNGNLLGENLLDVLDNGEAQAQDAQTRGQAKQRGVKGMPPQAILTQHLVLPRPEEVHAKESDTHQDGDDKPEGDIAGSALLSGVSLDWEALLAEGNGDIIQLGTERCELVVAHSIELFTRVILLYVAHERDPIHIAATHRRLMPIIHIARPSATGPRPPSDQPAGDGVSFADLR